MVDSRRGDSMGRGEGGRGGGKGEEREGKESG